MPTSASHEKNKIEHFSCSTKKKETSRSLMFSQKLRNCKKDDEQRKKLTFTPETLIGWKLAVNFCEPISNCAQRSAECAKPIYTLFGRTLFYCFFFIWQQFVDNKQKNRQMALYSELRLFLHLIGRRHHVFFNFEFYNLLFE